jgi:hypothetical protein
MPKLRAVTTLEGEMRQLLLEMTLLQYGRTQAFAKSSRGERDAAPGGEAHPLAEHWQAEWERDPSEDTIAMARADLEAWRKSALIETDDSTLEDWVVEDGEGYAVAQVAGKFGIAEARVRRIRLRASRESEFGLPTLFASHRESEAEKHVRIRNLAERGCTERQIAFQVGVGKSTVRRALGRAA